MYNLTLYCINLITRTAFFLPIALTVVQLPQYSGCKTGFIRLLADLKHLITYSLIYVIYIISSF